MPFFIYFAIVFYIVFLIKYKHEKILVLNSFLIISNCNAGNILPRGGTMSCIFEHWGYKVEGMMRFCWRISGGGIEFESIQNSKMKKRFIVFCCQSFTWASSLLVLQQKTSCLTIILNLEYKFMLTLFSYKSTMARYFR